MNQIVNAGVYLKRYKKRSEFIVPPRIRDQITIGIKFQEVPFLLHQIHIC